MQILRKLKPFFEIADDISDILIHLREKPRPLDYCSIGLRLINSTLKHYDEFQKSGFSKDWKYHEMWVYQSFLYNMCHKNYDMEVKREVSGMKDYVCQINGQEIGWIDHGENDVSGPYFKKGKTQQCLEALGQGIWEYVDSDHCVVSKNSRDQFGDQDAAFKVDDLHNEVYYSRVAEEIMKRCKAFLEQGYNRSIMLYGSPGTGKSSAMKFVSKHLGGRTLRINVSEVENMEHDDVILAISLLRPKVLMIDDFDRLSNPTKFLSTLEQVSRETEVVLCSANNIKEIDPAVIRPGRFDEIVEVEHLDEEIYDKLIGENIPEDTVKTLKKMPIVYVKEFNLRKQVVGEEQAIKEVVDLANRIKRVFKKQEEEDEDEAEYAWLKNFNQRKKKKKKILTDSKDLAKLKTLGD